MLSAGQVMCCGRREAKCCERVGFAAERLWLVDILGGTNCSKDTLYFCTIPFFFFFFIPLLFSFMKKGRRTTQDDPFGCRSGKKNVQENISVQPCCFTLSSAARSGRRLQKQKSFNCDLKAEHFKTLAPHHTTNLPIC